MGKTHREAIAILTARYNAVWKKAEAEYERYGEISDSTHAKLCDIEMEMEILGV